MDIEEFLAPYPTEIQDLAAELRRIIGETISSLQEKVYPGWQLIGYRQGIGRKSRYFAFLAPFSDHIQLGFEWGILMVDPQKLLSGNGKQVRQMAFKTAEELNEQVIKTYLREACRIAHLTKDEKTSLFMVREEIANP